MAAYNRGAFHIFNQDINWSTDTVNVTLNDVTYTFARGDNVLSDLTEIVATNYSAGGETVAGLTVVEDDANNRAELDGTDRVFTGIGNGGNDTFDSISFWDDTLTTPAVDPLLFHQTVTSTLTNGGDVTLVWDAEGIAQLA